MASAGEAAFEPETSSSDFRDFLDARRAEGSLDCDLGRGELKRHACLIYLAAAAYASDSSSREFAFYYALEAMNVVSNVVSTGRHNLIRSVTGKLPKTAGEDIDLCLERRFGICGNHATSFVFLLREMGFRARRVQFYYLNEQGARRGHIAAEVDLDGWRFFDTSWAAVFLLDENDRTSLASVEEIVSGTPVVRVANEAQAWGYHTRSNYDAFAYLEAQPSIVFGTDSGIVRIDDIDPDAGEVPLKARPRVVGDRIDDGPFEGVELELMGLEGRHELRLEILRVVGACSNARLCVDDSCVPLDEGRSSFDLDSPSRIRVVPDATSQRCYGVLEGIDFERLRP